MYPRMADYGYPTITIMGNNLQKCRNNKFVAI